MERFLSLSSHHRSSRKTPNWIIYFFAAPNEINILGPEWVDLDKNVNQGSGSRVITLRLDGGRGGGRGGSVGGGAWQGSMLSVQGLVLYSNYLLWHLRIFGDLGIKTHSPRWVDMYDLVPSLPATTYWTRDSNPKIINLWTVQWHSLVSRTLLNPGGQSSLLGLWAEKLS